MQKLYDGTYFDRWYRQRRIGAGPALTRKVALAVSVAEYHLARPIRSVIDIGCGEGAWRAPLLKLRPKLRYLGLDSSPYVVERYGRTRNLRYLQFGDLAEQRFDEAFDLVVCADVLHYVEDDEVERGLSGMTDLCAGAAFIEIYCVDDPIEGDMDGFQRRSGEWYRTRLASAELTACGNHCYLARPLADQATALELPPAATHDC